MEAMGDAIPLKKVPTPCSANKCVAQTFGQCLINVWSIVAEYLLK
jgi:hypothetical protein